MCAAHQGHRRESQSRLGEHSPFNGSLRVFLYRPSFSWRQKSSLGRRVTSAHNLTLPLAPRHAPQWAGILVKCPLIFAPLSFVVGIILKV